LGSSAFFIARGFRIPVPEWLAPLATFFIVGYFFFKSRWQTRKAKESSRLAEG
jgi:hypothetical protein